MAACYRVLGPLFIPSLNLRLDVGQIIDLDQLDWSTQLRDSLQRAFRDGWLEAVPAVAEQPKIKLRPIAKWPPEPEPEPESIFD